MATAQRTSAPRPGSSSRRSAATASRASTTSTSAAAGRRQRLTEDPAAKSAKRVSAATSATQSSTASKSEDHEQQKSWPFRSTAVSLPVVNLRVPVPGADVPSAAAIAQTRWAAQVMRANLPPVERLVYYGGLTALAVAGVLEWPVVAVAGAGVWVASRTRRVEGAVAPR